MDVKFTGRSNLSLVSLTKNFKTLRINNIILEILASIVVILISSLIVWNNITFWENNQILILVLLIFLGNMFTIFLTSKLTKFPRVEYLEIVVTTLTFIYLIILAIIVLIRLYYSRLFVLLSYTFSLLYFLAEYFLIKRKQKILLAVLSFQKSPNIKDLSMINSNIEFIEINNPNEEINNINGIVIVSTENLNLEWSKFLIKHALKGIPVYHISEIYEKILGKIPLEYLYEEFVLDINKPMTLKILKRLFDIILVTFLFPFALLLGLVIAILIKIDSRGPLFFIQERVGKGGKTYKMIKFRTMYIDSEKNGPQFASLEDPRVTRVGKILRKYRLDEIPQFINVLKGEMSLIGPRPEQVKFAELFEKEIPFYSYRYLVKPGITGWAQINQGYAASLEETKEKLEYDLYYIKNQSLWLDLMITLKTIKILLTKHGAR